MDKDYILKYLTEISNDIDESIYKKKFSDSNIPYYINGVRKDLIVMVYDHDRKTRTNEKLIMYVDILIETCNIFVDDPSEQGYTPMDWLKNFHDHINQVIEKEKHNVP